MTKPTAPRQRASYSMPFKLDLVQRMLQPGACVAQLARQNRINDNLHHAIDGQPLSEAFPVGVVILLQKSKRQLC